MNLTMFYPAKKPYDFENLMSFPNKHGGDSGYFLIAAAKTSNIFFPEYYMCLTDDSRSNVWIEKISMFNSKKFMCFEECVKIDNDEEFNTVHDFFVKEGILDDSKRSR